MKTKFLVVLIASMATFALSPSSARAEVMLARSATPTAATPEEAAK